MKAAVTPPKTKSTARANNNLRFFFDDCFTRTGVGVSEGCIVIGVSRGLVPGCAVEPEGKRGAARGELLSDFWTVIT
jgi:hypothetical protein